MEAFTPTAATGRSSSPLRASSADGIPSERSGSTVPFGLQVAADRLCESLALGRVQAIEDLYGWTCSALCQATTSNTC